MPCLCRYKLAQQIASVAIGCIAMLVANSGEALASYGPPPPSPAPVPGGYYCILTSQTVGPAGKLIGPLRLGGLVASLTARRRPFPAPVQSTITVPYAPNGECQGGPGIGDAGFRGYRAVGGVGILVQRGGAAYRGTFVKPFVLRLASRSINRSSIVVVWNGGRFVIAPGTVVGRRSARVMVDANSDFAVLTPVRSLRRSGAAMRRKASSVSAVRTQLPGSGPFAALFLLPATTPPPGLGVEADT